MFGPQGNRKLFRARSPRLQANFVSRRPWLARTLYSGRLIEDIVSGALAPVLAKHTKHALPPTPFQERFHVADRLGL
jgi:hypothetical protein